jgi:ketosteroid isomerase-like protein
MNATQLAAELMRHVNERDLPGAAELFASHAEICFPRFAPRRVFRGEAGLAEFFDWMTQTLPLQTFAVDRVVGTDTTAVVEFEVAGTSVRGHDFDNIGAIVVDCLDGRITSVRIYVDTADLGRILGLAVA